MAIDIDFSRLNTNPFAAFDEGQQQGQQQRQKQAQQAAGNVFMTDPDKAASILAPYDPQAAMKYHEYGQAQRQEKIRADALGQAAKGDYKGAQATAIGGNDLETYNAIAKMDKDQREQAKSRADTFASVGLGLKDKPYEVRKAIIQQIKPTLVQQGMDPAAIDGFDPTDENIAGFTAQAMSVKDLIDKAEKDRSFGETQRHNKAGEANAAGQLGVARGNLGVARGGLAVRQQEFSARKAAGGFGTPGVGAVVGPNLPGSPDDYEFHPAGGQ